MLTVLQLSTGGYLALAGAAAIAASLVLRRRHAAPGTRAAAIALRVFWGALGSTAIGQLAMLALAGAGADGPAAALAASLLMNLTSTLALGALTAYFAFVFTGRRRAIQLVAATYSAILAWATWLVIQAEPTGMRLTRWFVEVEHLHPPTPAQMLIPTLAVLFPAIVGAIAFIVLGARASGATRFRGLAVGSALLVWFVTSMLSATPGAQANDALQLMLRATGLAGLGSILVAYHPPAGLRERWGLVALGEELAYDERRRAVGERATRTRAALADRARDLL